MIISTPHPFQQLVLGKLGYDYYPKIVIRKFAFCII